MAFDEHVAQRIRTALAGRRGLEERRMFGGLTILLGGHMTAGVMGEELMLRVGPKPTARSCTAPGVAGYSPRTGSRRTRIPPSSTVTTAPEASSVEAS